MAGTEPFGSPIPALLCVIGVLFPSAFAAVCPAGVAVTAFFAGEVDLGSGNVPCTPSMEQCYFPGKVHSGPDSDGIYMINWDDEDPNNRMVHATNVKRTSGQACDGPAPAAAAVAEDEDNWVPPEIPCTVMPRLHWEASDPKFNKEAVESLKRGYKPDEVLDGFDWHVVLRFNDVDRCENTYNSLQRELAKCKEQDREKCRTHPYVKEIEYVGDDPATRRKTGRAVHSSKKTRQEL
eukprot:gnl/TRDRNA2_/TRDRNA2_42505_c0_seq1.p1 gnl/TRDRNA2_/TRDRNA2_42505_c0~~gnl/TRDRNA2_/TRDRNA2_42505_c0_seq1.p1  ORF type:complete len:236 (-),score=31.98 gnl/TRDRNA2_/TRDRNA2_42505_c0_seq1:179-886(-)